MVVCASLMLTLMSLSFSGIVKERSAGNTAASFLMGNYLFVFAYYFSFKYPNTAKKKEPQVKLEVLPKRRECVTVFTRYCYMCNYIQNS